MKEAVLDNLQVFGKLVGVDVTKKQMAEMLPGVLDAFWAQAVGGIFDNLNGEWTMLFDSAVAKLVKHQGECTTRRLVRDFIASLVRLPNIPSEILSRMRNIRDRVENLIQTLEAGIQKRSWSSFAHQLLFNWLPTGLKSLEMLRSQVGCLSSRPPGPMSK